MLLSKLVIMSMYCIVSHIYHFNYNLWSKSFWMRTIYFYWYCKCVFKNIKMRFLTYNLPCPLLILIIQRKCSKIQMRSYSISNFYTLTSIHDLVWSQCLHIYTVYTVPYDIRDYCFITYSIIYEIWQQQQQSTARISLRSANPGFIIIHVSMLRYNKWKYYRVLFPLYFRALPLYN